ncbi:hypothetical protein M758_9G161400 [Ceratodon purpureus]|nr:hypothetical protein M758_9G161400 [Ceratodon purpureus]
MLVLHTAKNMLQAAESDADKAICLNGGNDPNVRHRARNMLKAFQHTMTEGVGGYFNGLHAQIILKTLSSAALDMLMIKEKVAPDFIKTLGCKTKIKTEFTSNICCCSDW